MIFLIWFAIQSPSYRALGILPASLKTYFSDPDVSPVKEASVVVAAPPSSIAVEIVPEGAGCDVDVFSVKKASVVVMLSPVSNGDGSSGSIISINFETLKR